MIKFLFTILIILCFTYLQAQEAKNMYIKKAIGTIIVDGILNESDWTAAIEATDFVQNYPSDTMLAAAKTITKITYDNNNIYVAAICYDDLEGNYVIQSLQRDFNLGISDAFVVYLDPFKDQLNGFQFAVTPLGVQREALISGGGGFRGVSTDWDNKWKSKVIRKKGKWIVEMAIPFKTIRFNNKINTWGINFQRNDFKRNEKSMWNKIPKNYGTSSITFEGNLIWDETPKKSGTNVSLIPYIITNTNSNYETHPTNTNTGANIGGDAKIAITSSLNLDLTINPDFSQVEVDQQQTNLTRFSLFFPEKRQFFIENADLFAQYGFSRIRPFFSRRIGLSNYGKIPIIAGARLSGKINKNWRIGALNMQTAKKVFKIGDDTVSVFSQNYSMATIQRTVFKRSRISTFLVNRQTINNESGLEINNNDYNRVIGIDYNLASSDNKWMGKIFTHQSFSPNDTFNTKSNANATWLFYNSKNIFAMWNHEFVGKNYDAQVGFVPRNKQYNPEIKKLVRLTYWRFQPIFNYYFWPKSSKYILKHGPAFEYDNFKNKYFKNTDYSFNSGYNVNFKNTSSINVRYREIFTKLIFNTDVTFTGKQELPKGKYYYRSFSGRYSSDVRKKLFGNVRVEYGSYYIGSKLSFNGTFNLRTPPWGTISLTFRRDQIRQPGEFPNADITLIGSRVSLSFSKSVFFKTFIQYNSKINNFNINTRIQWRFRPMSDVFFVYTDNYNQYLGIKNRALILKFVYWLSL